MTTRQNISILLLFICLPTLLLFKYDDLVQLSGSYWEIHTIGIKLILLAIPLLSSAWLIKRSSSIQDKAAKYFWIIFSAILVVFFVIFIYLAYSLSHLQIGG